MSAKVSGSAQPLRGFAITSICCALVVGCAVTDPKPPQSADLIIGVTGDGEQCLIHKRDVECSVVSAFVVRELKLPPGAYIRVEVAAGANSALDQGLKLREQLMAAGFGLTVLALHASGGNDQ